MQAMKRGHIRRHVEKAMPQQVRQIDPSGMEKAVSVADYIVERLAAEGISRLRSSSRHGARQREERP